MNNQVIGALAIVAGIICLIVGAGALKVVGVVAVLLGLVVLAGLALYVASWW